MGAHMDGQQAGAGDAGEVFSPAAAQIPSDAEYLPRGDPGGRPSHVPTDEMRRQVERAAEGDFPVLFIRPG